MLFYVFEALCHSSLRNCSIRGHELNIINVI